MKRADVFYDRRAARDAERAPDDPRLQAATAFAVRHVDRGGRVLDVGCGVGFVSSMVANIRGADVVGIDRSSAAVALAERRPAPHRGSVGFVCADFLELGAPAIAFDVVLLIDAYEHFAVKVRRRLHEAIGQVLAAGGRVVVTAPTPWASQRVRDMGAEQPVDEDVSGRDLEALAVDLGGRLSVRQVAVDGFEYWHAMVQT